MADQCKIDVKFFAPPEDLAPCFTTFYRLEIVAPPGSPIVDYLQPEWANLRFFASNPPSARVFDGPSLDAARFQATGPSSRPTEFAIGTTRMWGIGLLPLGWARFVGEDAAANANIIVDGEAHETFARFAPLCGDLCNPDGDDAEQFARIIGFFRNLAEPHRDADRILRVHDRLVDPQLLQVTELADSTGLSKRTLERLCSRHFGFPPRLLLRRQRLMRSLAAFMLDHGSWTEAIDRHYHDQSHFVHEFHAFMQMSPIEYAALPHPILSAFMTERQRVWGSPAQTLDTPAH